MSNATTGNETSASQGLNSGSVVVFALPFVNVLIGIALVAVYFAKREKVKPSEEDDHEQDHHAQLRAKVHTQALSLSFENASLEARLKAWRYKVRSISSSCFSSCP